MTTRQTVGYVALTAVVSFLLGVVATGTRPGRPTDVLPLRPGAEAAKPITVLSEAAQRRRDRAARRLISRPSPRR